MKKNEECKLVKDLLPSYLDKITDEVTNKFVEEHIEQCEDCKKILKSMGEETILDKVKEGKKINYLKKVKRTQRMTIFFILLIMIIIIFIIMKFAFSPWHEVILDEKGKTDYIQTFFHWLTAEKITVEETKISHIIVTSSDKLEITDEKETIKTIIIVTFDDKRNVCIGTKRIIEGLTQEQLKQRYEEDRKEDVTKLGIITDVKIKDNKLISNFNAWVGNSKEEVRKMLYESYPTNQIIEI